MRRNLIIVGAPRSGTSLTAAALRQHGYYVGSIADSRLREGDDFNPSGYFEADDIVAANVSLFQAVGYEHHNTWLFDPIPDAAVIGIANLEPRPDHSALLERYEAHEPWLWKDPRFCFTLAYWWKLVDHERVGVVLTRRDPKAVHLSLSRTGWASGVERSLDTREFARHLSTAEQTIRALGIPHVVVEFEDYFNHPEIVARELGNLSGAPVTAESLEVRPELRHGTARDALAARLRRTASRLLTSVVGRTR